MRPPMPHACLIVTDVQNDFMPDGALPVPGGDEVVEPINALGVRRTQSLALKG